MKVRMLVLEVLKALVIAIVVLAVLGGGCLLVARHVANGMHGNGQVRPRRIQRSPRVHAGT